MTLRTHRGSGNGARIEIAAIAAAVVFAAAGCATEKPRPPPYFKVVFEDGCLVSAGPTEENCPNGKKGCLKVTGGQKVRIVAEPNPPDRPNDFVLQFDPFGKTTIESEGGVIDWPTLRHPEPLKPYTFTVRAKSSPERCPPKVIDPQIILD